MKFIKNILLCLFVLTPMGVLGNPYKNGPAFTLHNPSGYLRAKNNELLELSQTVDEDSKWFYYKTSHSQEQKKVTVLISESGRFLKKTPDGFGVTSDIVEASNVDLIDLKSNKVALKIQNDYLSGINPLTKKQVLNDETTFTASFEESPAYQIDVQTLAQEDLKKTSKALLDKNWNFLRYFGRVSVVGNNEVRLIPFYEELQKIGIKRNDVNVLPSVDKGLVSEHVWKRMVRWQTTTDNARMGQTAATIAHYNAIKNAAHHFYAAQKALKKAKDAGDKTREKEALTLMRENESVLILEDNAGFGYLEKGNSVKLTDAGVNFRNALSELPKDWDMLYFVSYPFGDLHQGTAKHILKMSYGVSTKIFVVRAHMYQRIIAALKRKLDVNSKEDLVPIDHEIAKFQSNSKSYVIYPAIGLRLPSSSQVGGGNDVGTYWQQNQAPK